MSEDNKRQTFGFTKWIFGCKSRGIFWVNIFGFIFRVWNTKKRKPNLSITGRKIGKYIISVAY